MDKQKVLETLKDCIELIADYEAQSENPKGLIRIQAEKLIFEIENE